MSPEEARELHHRIVAGMDCDFFVQTMLAAVLDTYEEVARIELCAAFRQDRNTRTIIVPDCSSPSGWKLLSISAADQARIYL